MKNDIEINEKFKEALDLIENTDKHVFITGKAGTGKSTLLEYFRSTSKKQVVVLASTGVAAVNINGQTIHSFFKFKPDITLEKVKKVKKKGDKDIYKKIDAIIIDEISMVRADLLDCVDKFLKLNGKNKELPFGGIQMVFFGDLYQLPPVVTADERRIFKDKYKTEYFFSSHLFENMELKLIELEKIYRQKDEQFIDILNSIRNNTVTEDKLCVLNERYNPDFEPPLDEFYIHLTSRNDQAQVINENQLKKIKGKEYVFESSIKGDFDRKYFSTETNLKIKKGSQIMLLNNDSFGRWVNGTIGRVKTIENYNQPDEEAVVVELNDGSEVTVTRYTWEIFKYEYNDSTKSLNTETIGSFTQYPLKLAWAVTIHKSQGKTFEKVIIDIGRGTFASGQMYVALSRCTSLEGMILKQKIQKRHILKDWRISDFLTKYQYKQSDKNIPLNDKIEFIKNAIKNNLKLEITYLKTNDEKTKRVIEPKYVGEMKYNDKSFIGVKAHCLKQNDLRHFRVDRIISLNVIEDF